MTFSLLRRLAGTRGLGVVMQRCQRVFPVGVLGAPIEPRARAVLRRRTISGPMGSEHDTYAEHNTRQHGVFPPSFGNGSATLAGMVPTRWDARLLVRAAVVSAVALGLAWLVTAATDEGGVSWGGRAGRTLPLTPACAAIGAWVALAPVLARGEALALAALGRSRVQVAAAAVAGAFVVAFVAAVLIGTASAVDAIAFFPRAARASAWVWKEGWFVDRAHGLRVGADGAPVRLAREVGEALAPLPRHGRAAAAIATAVAGLALPLLVAHGRLARSVERTYGARDRHIREDGSAMLASAAAVAASVVLFQAAAVRNVPALLGAVPPVALLAFAIYRYRISP
jgi:hypothetical protein